MRLPVLDRVRSGRFGACLMREDRGLVADCVAAMAAAVDIPVSVKCRIGVDEQEPREALAAFAEAARRPARRLSSSMRAKPGSTA